MANRFVGPDVASALKGTLTPARNMRRGLRAATVAVGLAVVLAFAGVTVKEPILAYGAAAALMVCASYVLSFLYTRSDLPGTVPVSGRLAWRTVVSHARRSVTFAAVPMTLVLLVGLLASILGGIGAAAAQRYVPQGPAGSTLVQSTKPLSRGSLLAAGDILQSPGTALFAALAPTPVPKDDMGRPYTYWGHFSPVGLEEIPVYVATQSDVETLLGRPLGEQERTAFAEGSVLSLDPDLVSDGEIKLQAPATEEPDAGRLVHETLPALAVDVLDGPQRALPMLLLEVTAGGKLGIPQPNFSVGYLAPGADVPNNREEARVRGVLAADVGRNFLDLQVERGSTTAAEAARIVLWSLAAVLVAAAAVSALIIALVLHEQRRTLSVLSAVGASRRHRSRLMVRQTLLTLGGGAVLGAAAAALSAPVVLASASLPWTWWPVMSVVTGVLVVTVVSSLMGYAGGRRRMPTPRTV